MIRDETLFGGGQLSPPRMGSGMLAVVASGALDVMFRGAFWQLRPGWALWTSGSGLESAQAWSETRVLRLEWDQAPSDTRLFAASALLRESMARLAEIAGFGDAGLERALLTVIRCEAQLSWSIPLTPPWPRSAWLEKAAIVLRDVGPDEVSIDWLAGKMEMCPRSLNRRFARETGLSPFDWRRQARVIEATRLMSLGLQTQDIVTQVGFQSRNAVTEAFQHQFSLPPARFWHGFSGASR